MTHIIGYSISFTKYNRQIIINRYIWVVSIDTTHYKTVTHIHRYYKLTSLISLVKNISDKEVNLTLVIYVKNQKLTWNLLRPAPKNK